MGRINKLTATGVRHLSQPGYYGDGQGLWLQVSRFGTKSWVFRFTRHGKTREMGLGPLAVVSLARAREKASRCRELLLDGIDPIEARRAERANQRLEAAKSRTFSDCAQAYIDAHRAGWKSEKHIAQWTRTLEQYALPVFGALPVAEVDMSLVMQALEPIWREKPETASRVRGRIESVLSWATVRGYRTGDNPARWRGHLDKLLPKRSRVIRVRHHPALPYVDLPEFMTALRAQESIGGLALEFTILTASRTTEAIRARFEEFALADRIWIVPAARMKTHREHRVPLPEDAVQIITLLQDLRLSDFVFPSPRLREKPISNMAMLQVLERMGRRDLTVHGFRSTFRDWCAEQTNYPREVAEAALAHTVGNKVEAAYRRGDIFEKRRSLMEDWAFYCRLTSTEDPTECIQAN